MKLNNYGFGMKETVIYLSILFLILLFVSCSISSFYRDLEFAQSSESKKEGYLPDYIESNGSSVNDTVIATTPSIDLNGDTNVQVIQMNHYYEAEQKLYQAAMNYAVENSIPPSEYVYTVRLEDLINLKYMSSKIVDYVDGSECSGYSNIISDSDGYQVESYIYCKNYKTEGYK